MSFLSSGLRGAVTFSLAIHLDRSTEVGRTILSTTLLLICFTVWVLGAAADPILNGLDIRLVLTHLAEKHSQCEALIILCLHRSTFVPITCPFFISHSQLDRYDFIRL